MTDPSNLDALNQRVEDWERVAPDVHNEVHAALICLARTSFAEYCRLSIVWKNYEFIPHVIHSLIYDSLEMCRAAGKHCTLVLPPEHGKTFTVSEWIVYEIAKNPRIRVGLVSADDGLSKRNMIRIRKALTSELTKFMWPHLKPDTKRSSSGGKGEWSVTRLYMEGNADPTVEVFPLHGPIEGSRFDILWCDDIVTRVCYESKAERDKVYDAFHLSFMNRLTGNGIAVTTNNTWHREDCVNDMTREGRPFHVLWIGYRGFDSLYIKVHNAVANWPHPVDLEEVALWGGCPVEKLHDKFAASEPAYKRLFEQRPTLRSDLRFGPAEEWATYTREEASKAYRLGATLYAFLDTAGGKDAKHHDFAALSVVMIGQDQLVYVMAIWMEKALPRDQVVQVWEHHRAWQIEGGVWIELQQGVQDWIRPVFQDYQEELRKRNDPTWQLPWYFKNAVGNKGSRIEALITPIRQKWVRFPDGFLQWKEENSPRGRSWREFINQMDDHPAKSRLEHDDGPDSLAGAVEIAKRLGPGLSKSDQDHLALIGSLQNDPLMVPSFDGGPPQPLVVDSAMLGEFADIQL